MYAALVSHRRPGWGWLRALLAVVAALLLAAVRVHAADGDVQPVPRLTDRVIDEAALLSAAQRQALVAKLAQFEQQTGTQIVVLTVPTTAPEDIASYAQRVGDAWKIGRKEVGDGLLLVVAKNDHAVFIATAKALEGAVPDLAAHQIIDGAIVPAFRHGDFAGGLNAGLDQLMARIRGEALPAPAATNAQARGRRAHGGGIDFGQLAMFFFIAVPVIGGVLSALLGRRLGSLATAAGAGGVAWVLGAGSLLAVMAGVVALVMVGVLGVGRRGGGLAGGMPIIWGGGGGFGGGGFGGGGGGGGFSSGGGGDFGGGGASGRW